MDHPQVVNTMRTGYPEGNYPEEEYCEHCSYEVDRETGVKYEDVSFCCTDCLGKYLVEHGYAERIA